jgi:predicted metal-dependent peptidase
VGGGRGRADRLRAGLAIDAAATKLAAARTRLALERPFIGALALHLPAIPTPRVRTVATDARALYYNPRHIASVSLAETQFLLAHEALHAALLHFARRGHRLRERWNRACDYAVNQLLADDGLRPPEEALWNPAYRGLAAEAIYPLLRDDAPETTLDEHWFGGGATAGRSVDEAAPTEGEPLADEAFMAAHRDGFDEIATRAPTLTHAAALAEAWQERLAAAAMEAQASGRLGASWRSVLGDLAEPRLAWRALLDRFVRAVARDDYSFARPARREGEAILPGPASAEIEIVLALDTSGSIALDDFRRFVEEMDALKGQVRARVTLLACDMRIAPGAPWRFEPWERIELPPSLAGGGGTRFTPVFEWVEASGARPDALVYFTDALGEFPAAAPAYPVLWLVQGNAPVPFGERVSLN